MTMRHDREQVRAFMDLLSEELLSLSDEEILARAKKEGVDVAGNLQAFQGVVNAQAMSAKSERLRQARKALEAHEPAAPRSALAGLSFDELKARLAKLVASGELAGDSRLLMAHRSGKFLDEEDLRSALEDYDELMRSKESGDPDVR